MIRHQGYCFPVRSLSIEQAGLLENMDGQARWLWNLFLTADLNRKRCGRSPAGFAEKCRVLTVLRARDDLCWLANGSVSAQQQTLRHLTKAWKMAFDGLARQPAFKKKGRDSGIHWSGRERAVLDQRSSRIRLPKIGWISYRATRHINGDIVNVAMRQVGGRWKISVGTEQEVTEPAKRSHNRRIGLDLGIACHVAASDGRMISGPNALRAGTKALKKAQQKLARAKKGSNRRKKQVIKVARIHERIGNVRKDHMHKLTTTIAKSHGLVCVEDLRVANMIRKAKGTVDQPGRNVHAKSGLNRRILDQGWSEMRRQLAYKLEWTGGTLVAVPPANTSRRCSACQYTDKASRLSQAMFICTSCGHEMNADTNAAKNILVMGYAMARAAGPVAVKARGGDANRQPVNRVREASRLKTRHSTAR